MQSTWFVAERKKVVARPDNRPQAGAIPRAGQAGNRMIYFAVEATRGCTWMHRRYVVTREGIREGVPAGGEGVFHEPG